MPLLKQELIELAISNGAINARVASTRMMDGPPSGDPTYMLPHASSVISYAVSLGRDWIPDYFGKVTRSVFARIMFEQYQKVNTIGEVLCGRLKEDGFTGVTPSPNGSYRQEDFNKGRMVPDFSHRYAALASGLGCLGWSGNVLVQGFGSAVFLGSVITDAVLVPDEPLLDTFCDHCKLCTVVCPTGFMHTDESETVKLGGREYTCNRKRSHLRCGLSCGGFVGISRDGKWSSWAALRYKIPDDDQRLGEIFRKAISDPHAEYILKQILFEPTHPQRGVLDRSLEDTQPTCCNCALVCSGDKAWRAKLVHILHSSGIVVRQEDGSEKAVPPEDVSPLFTWELSDP